MRKTNPTRVGHSQQDATDVYAGRHRDNNVIRHARNTEIGDRGWLGNPFVIASSAEDIHREQNDIEIVETRKESIFRFSNYLWDRIGSDTAFRHALSDRVRGKTLGCWCQTVDDDRPPCHGEVIAQAVDGMANGIGPLRGDG